MAHRLSPRNRRLERKRTCMERLGTRTARPSGHPQNANPPTRRLPSNPATRPKHHGRNLLFAPNPNPTQHQPSRTSRPESSHRPQGPRRPPPHSGRPHPPRRQSPRSLPTPRPSAKPPHHLALAPLRPLLLPHPQSSLANLPATLPVSQMKSSGIFLSQSPSITTQSAIHPFLSQNLSAPTWRWASAHGAVGERPWADGRAPMGRWALRK